MSIKTAEKVAAEGLQPTGMSGIKNESAGSVAAAGSLRDFESFASLRRQMGSASL
jgi:hypothetical protein